MKRIVALLLCGLFLCGCGATEKSDNKKISVVTTIFPIYDFVRAVGGEKIDIKLLIKPGMEIHSYDPVPSEIKSIYDADLFLYIGGESEAWVDKIIGDKKVNSKALIECADKLFEEGEKEYDEHIWTSPQNAEKMLDEILKSLIKTDPENSGFYTENHQNYVEKIKAVEAKTRSVAERCEAPFILVADRFPFRYFADSYNIDYVAAADGCAISTDISLKTMTRLIDTIREKNLKYAYFVEMSNKEIANSLAEQTGVKLLELHSAHNVTLEDFKNGITYVDIMERNYKALKEGMN